MNNFMYAWIVSISIMLGACASQQRMGMVIDPNTGLQYGSIIEKNIFVDASQFENRKLKLRIRNTSGDSVFDFHKFLGQLKSNYGSRGYEITEGSDYGLLIDINVTYSGQIRQNMSAQFGFLGAAAGGISGAAITNNKIIGATAGSIAGATLGSIIGSYVAENTYVIVGYVTLGVIDAKQGKKKTRIIFSSSNKTVEESSGFKPFRQKVSTGVSVFGGGRNISQREITKEVRQRFIRIISEAI